MSELRIEIGDVRQKLKEMPDESINCIVTSPPYFGLRDYGMPDQIGLEQSPDEFVGVLVDVFREARRVLRADGTLWLNIGDSYASHDPGGYHGDEARDRLQSSGLAGAFVTTWSTI